MFMFLLVQKCLTYDNYTIFAIGSTIGVHRQCTVHVHKWCNNLLAFFEYVPA